MIDARVPNFCHHSPPVTRLGSASNFVDLDLSDERFGSLGGFGDVGEFGQANASSAYANEADVSDSF